MAVALPALLAACTAEEVVEQSPVANLSGRAVLDSNFSVNVAEGINSRFAWEGLNWKYEAGDQFGAGVVDPAEYGKISETNMLGNYIFAKAEDGKYKTDSQMSEGTYLFYSYDGFKTKSSRSLVTFDITSQKTDLKDAEAMVNDYANQLMFSPLYNIEAEYSAEPMPLEFRSFWGVAAFKFKNNSGQTLKINQIVLKDSKNQFIVKGGINPALLAKAGLTYVYNENGAKYNGTEGKANEHNYVPVAVSTEIDKELTATYTETKKKEAIEDLYEAFEDALYETAFSTEIVEGEGKSSFIAMNCKNYKMKHGETVTAYMLVPQHDGGDMGVEIMVVDENDESWSVFVEDEKATNKNAIKEVDGLETLSIVRHKTNAIFGKTTDGKSMKTLSITEDDLQENSGYYIDNNKDLIALINANLGTIDVHNTGDTYIDAEVVAAIKEYTGTHVNFSNVIEIKDAEALVVNEEKETDLSLTEITFNGGAVVKGANKKAGINGAVEFGEGVEFNEKLTIEEGANVTLTEGSYKDIVNSGNLTVIGGEGKARAIETYNGDITNEAGTVTLKGSTPKVNMKAGSLKYEALKDKTLEVDSEDLTIAAGADLTVGEYVTLNLNNSMTIQSLYDNVDKDAWTKKSTWTIDGTLSIAANKTLTVTNKLAVNGKVNGAGKLETKAASAINKAGNKVVYTDPVVEVAENAEVSVASIVVDEKSTVNNAGEFGWDINSSNVEVYGEVVMKSISSRLEVTKCVKTVGTGEDAEVYEGVVDNSENGVVKAPANMLIAATVGAMTDGETLKNFDVDGQIGMLKVTGTWTITADPEVSAEDALEEMGVKVIRFMTTKAIEVRSNATLDLSEYDVQMWGVEEVIFSGRTKETSTLILKDAPRPMKEWNKTSTMKAEETAVYNNISYSFTSTANGSAEGLTIISQGVAVEVADDAKTTETNKVTVAGEPATGVVYKDMTIEAETAFVGNSKSQLILDNCTVKADVVAEARNNVIILGGDFTLPENGLIVKGTGQVAIVYEPVKVNGKLLTNPEEYKKYFDGVETMFPFTWTGNE